MTAQKHDGGKPRVDLLPTDSLIEVGRVAGFGATKYGEHNWRLGMPWLRVYAAILRHLFAWAAGNDLDRESELPHLAHAAWGCLALLHYARAGTGEDDRLSAARRAPQSAIRIAVWLTVINVVAASVVLIVVALS